MASAGGTMGLNRGVTSGRHGCCYASPDEFDGSLETMLKQGWAGACVLLAMTGCGDGSHPGATPPASGPAAAPKNIVAGTQQKVDAAIEAGKAATDQAIEAADGKPAPRDGGY
jgi:hypothetical protein